MLPKISDGVVSSLNKSGKDKEFIRDQSREMAEDDNILFSCITNTCMKVPTREMKEGFLRGAWLVYSLYKSQSEADEMNEEWGI